MTRTDSPRCGDYYESRLTDGGPFAFLILSEDLWNARVPDSVAVPIYESDDPPSQMIPAMGAGLRADCTKVQSVPHHFFGSRLGTCPEEPWLRIRIGVRLHLDIDGREKEVSSGADEITRTEWWPHQNEIHFADFLGLPNPKLFGVITNDQWNSREHTSYCTAVRLTSKTKDWRQRWEVEVAGGWVVCADLYSLPYSDMEQSPPAANYPTSLSLQESRDLATRQKYTLSLAKA